MKVFRRKTVDDVLDDMRRVPRESSPRYTFIGISVVVAITAIAMVALVAICARADSASKCIKSGAEWIAGDCVRRPR